ncbi:MAG TPA: hypothetical protein VFM70_05155 [Salinimicrobium sp.]|nr:hypothetical protein [Salinimicrobium sp.]
MQFKKTLLTFLLILAPFLVEAQCSMCRAVLESQDSMETAEGINNGIIYLMVFPYLFFAGLGIFIYKNRKKSS